MAVIDIGSNSVRLVIYLKKQKKLTKSVNKKVTLRLNEHLEAGYLTDKAIKRLIASLKKFKKIINKERPDLVYVVATEAIRIAQNQPDIIGRVYSKTGFKLRVLSEAEEAYYTYVGARALHYKEGLLVNVGGGSTEVIQFKAEEVALKSISFGTLNYNRDQLKAELKQLQSAGHLKLIISGGTARNVHRMLKQTHSRPYEKSDLIELLNTLSSMTLLERKSYQGLSEERADIICDGIKLILTICEHFDLSLINYSQYGLREGILFSQLEVS